MGRWILSLGLCGLASLAAAAEPLCDSEALADALDTRVTAAVPAQAHWLDGERLVWPGRTAAGRFLLLHEGREHELSLDAESWPEGLAERFRFVAPGVHLRLPPLERAQRLALLRGEVLLLQRDAEGRELARTALQAAGALDALFAPAQTLEDFGVQVDARQARGRLWAPTARRVEVCLHSPRGPAQRLEAHWQADSGSWTWQRAQDLRGWRYRYLVEVFVPGQGWLRQRVTDPYSLSLDADSRHSALLDLDAPALQPAGWRGHARPRKTLRLNELVVYELHVRDFSRDDFSVPTEQRGRYLAFTRRESTGMKHLRALARSGVTDVHLLPVFDLASVPERGCAQPVIPAAAAASDAQQAAVQAVAEQDCFNWGYDPFHFNAPEGSYSSDADDPAARVREFRSMVMALHGAGLRVGMDMVYNHLAAAGQHRHSVLDRIVPGYYQRLNAQGGIERSTCCDNSATEHAMMGKLMRDSVRHWTRTYALDSFRFDLMGHQPRAEMQALHGQLRREQGREIHFIGEGWNFGEVANGQRFVQASQLGLPGAGIGTFSDRARDAARGSSFGAVAEMRRSLGWLQGLADDPARRAQALQSADALRLGLAGTLADFRFVTADGRTRRGAEIDYGGQPAGYAAQPGEAVAYVENHDNHTLFDANVLKLPPDTPMAARVQAQTLGSALVAFSQGVAYFHAGQELLRSKSLDRNSYDSGDAFNRLDYALRDNGFGAGLPPQRDNGADWSELAPLLADARLKPTPADLRAALAQFHDLLRIRASSSLFRLPDTAELQRRLRLHNTGPGQDPALLVAELDGAGWPGAGFRGLLILLNASAAPRSWDLPQGVARNWRLHPVHRRAGAGDPRIAAQARQAGGRLSVPARSAVVWVR